MENETLQNSNSLDLIMSVGECIALVNQTLEYSYSTIAVEGEIASFKVNHNNYVFFDIKDDEGSLGCFMTVWQLRVPLEDGMRVRVIATPKLTAWGKFSLTVREVLPVGEGSLKRAYELLREKLQLEGLFAPERKRRLPEYPERVTVISSRQAAGYADFMKITQARWPLASIHTEHVRVQGSGAADDIIEAIEKSNAAGNPPQVIALVRGGGSADDLACFNDERLVRAIAASRVPIIAGIGHEIDETLASLAADVTASTPSNAAELLFPDEQQIQRQLTDIRRHLASVLATSVQEQQHFITNARTLLRDRTEQLFSQVGHELQLRRQLLVQLDPKTVLRRGYSIVMNKQKIVRTSTDIKVGDTIRIEAEKTIIESEVTDVRQK